MLLTAPVLKAGQYICYSLPKAGQYTCNSLPQFSRLVCYSLPQFSRLGNIHVTHCPSSQGWAIYMLLNTAPVLKAGQYTCNPLPQFSRLGNIHVTHCPSSQGWAIYMLLTAPVLKARHQGVPYYVTI